VRQRIVILFWALAGFGAAGQSALDQRKAYTGAPAAPNPPGAAIAATTGKYDIVGIKLGMTIKEALAALKAHSPKFTLKPDSIRYDFLPYALTYGITALPPLDPRNTAALPANSEQFYFSLTMDPNPVVVSKLTRVMTFGNGSMPLGDVVLNDLISKYGTPTYDTGVETFRNSFREIFWVDDSRGNRLQWSAAQNGVCSNTSTFKLEQQSFNQAANLAMNSTVLRSRIENGYFHQYEVSNQECAAYTMVRARLYDGTRTIGIPTPGLVGGMTVLMGSGPLDRSATDATHQYVLNAAKSRDAKQTDAAKQNRPKL
jgi:hypothetical protein